MRFPIAKLVVVLACLTATARVYGQAEDAGGQPPVWSPDPEIVSAFPERPVIGQHFTFRAPQWLKIHLHQTTGEHEMFQYMGPMHAGNDAATITIVPELPQGKNPRSTPDNAIKNGEEGLKTVLTNLAFSEPEHGTVNGMPAIRVYGTGKAHNLDMNVFLYVLGDDYSYVAEIATDSGPNRVEALRTLENAALTLTMTDTPKRPVRFDPAPQFLADLSPASESGGVTLSAPKGYAPADLAAIHAPGLFAGWSIDSPDPTVAGHATGKIWFFAYPHAQGPFEQIDIARTAEAISRNAPKGASNFTASPVEVGTGSMGLTGRYRSHMDMTDAAGQNSSVSEVTYVVYHDGKIVQAKAVVYGDDPKLLTDLETAILTTRLPDKIALPGGDAAAPAPNAPMTQAPPPPGAPESGLDQ